MAKSKTQFVCQNCAAVYTKWAGRCDNCGEWNTLVEQMAVSTGKSVVARSGSSGSVLKAQTMGSIAIGETSRRLPTGLSDLDEVLGGGILPGGVILLAGQPGIGKSTLLLQISSFIAHDAPVLYVSGEESAGQVRIRAERLGAEKSEKLSFVSSTSADDISATIRAGGYKLIIIDSIKTLALDEIT
jgi:DNA repair protein RadA/Sms